MAQKTTCKTALGEWEKNSGQKREEALVVKLYAQLPPIDKMDAEELNQLKSCEHLSLSTNSLDRITALALKNLKILSLGRNQIKRVMGLEEVGATLEQLWLSYNMIDKLDGLVPCIKLHTLYISNNRIKSWDEVSKLGAVTTLKDLLLFGNPVYGDMDKKIVKPHVLRKTPQIEILDGQTVTDQMKKAAEELGDM